MVSDHLTPPLAGLQMDCLGLKTVESLQICLSCEGSFRLRVSAFFRDSSQQRTWKNYNIWEKNFPPFAGFPAAPLTRLLVNKNKTAAGRCCQAPQEDGCPL